MTRITTGEARRDLAQVVRQVRQGERVILTRRGRPVAAVISTTELRRLQALDRRQRRAAADPAGRLERLQAEVREITADLADAEQARAEEGRIPLDRLLADLGQ